MLSQRMQANLLYRWFLTDEKMEAPEEAKLGEPWRSILRVTGRNIEQYEGVHIGWGRADFLREAVKEVCSGDELQAQVLVDQVYGSAAPVHFPTLAEVAATLPPVGWLWENWVPRGMLTMLGAYQGTGKSYLTMDLARVVLHGGGWPDGAAVTHEAGAARVVYVDAEGIPQVNSARAAAMGVDTGRMYLLMAEAGELLDLTRQVWRDRLLDLVYSVKPALVVIDSLNAVTSTGTKSVEDVNGLMSFLAGVARFFDTALVLVHHLRKPGGGQLMLPGISIHDFMGSAHITAMMRSVIGMSVVQQKGRAFSLNGARRVEVVKTNLTPVYPPALAVRLEQPAPDVVRFGYAPVDGDEADVEVTPEGWLVEFLGENGPTPFGELVTAAEGEGFSKATLYRARKRLGDRVVDSAGRRRRDNAWVLAEQVGEVEEEEGEIGEIGE